MSEYQMTPEQQAEYESLSPQARVMFEEAMKTLQEYEGMPLDGKVEKLMEAIAMLVHAHNELVERYDTMVGVINHHSAVITLLTNSVNNMPQSASRVETLQPGGPYL